VKGQIPVDEPILENLNIRDFNGYTEVLFDTIVFSKLHRQLPVLHQVPLARSRGLKLTNPSLRVAQRESSHGGN
jgi:hypothetical protein